MPLQLTHVACPAPTAPLDELDDGMMMSAVRAYVESDAHYGSTMPLSEKLVRSKKVEDAKNISHTFFAGGKGSVEQRHINAAALMYSIDILCCDQRVNMMANQIEVARAECFPLFFDVDLRATTAQHSVPELHTDYCRRVAAEVARFYPGLPRDSPQTLCIVNTRPPLTEPGGAIKYGLHLHFPHILVDTNAALHIREAVVSSFRMHYGERDGEAENPWNDVFDASVFAGSRGLRSIGSYKMKRATAGTTHEVHGREWTQKDESNNPVTYWPGLALRASGATDGEWQQRIDRCFAQTERGRGPARLLMRMDLRAAEGDATLRLFLLDMMLLQNVSRVRTYGEVTPGFTVYDGAPRPSAQLRRTTESGRAAGPATLLRARAVAPPPGITRNRQITDDAVVRDARPAIESHIRQLTDGAGSAIWPQIQVADIFVPRSTRHGKILTVSVRGHNSSTCINLRSRGCPLRRGNDHTNNHIFFDLFSGPPYIAQRCHSDKVPRRGRNFTQQGTMCNCRRFSSADIVPPYVHGVRFPQQLLDAIAPLAAYFDGMTGGMPKKRKASDKDVDSFFGRV